MGMIISQRYYSDIDQERYLKPIIFCNPTDKEKTQALSLNVKVAEKLSKVRPQIRTMRIEQCLSQVIATMPENAILKDFDVLFHPDYQIDVMKILIAACKKKRFRLIWPGRYENGMLYYSEEGYRDYEIFKIDDYDITCVI